MLAERVKQWTEHWKAEGLQAGIELGLKRGRKEGWQGGEAAMLLRKLEHRFGPLGEATRHRVLAADPEQLLMWGGRILSAETLADVFGDE